MLAQSQEQHSEDKVMVPRQLGYLHLVNPVVHNTGDYSERVKKIKPSTSQNAKVHANIKERRFQAKEHAEHEQEEARVHQSSISPYQPLLEILPNGQE